MKIPGVYSISNKIDGKMYIGASANLKQRIGNSKTMLRANKHHSILLQNAFNHLKEENFIFKILEITQDFAKREQFWCDYYKSNTQEFGYNVRYQTDSNKGNRVVITKEARKKISDANKGRLPSNFKEMIKVRQTPILLFVEGSFSKEFCSQREAERQTGVNYNAINNQLKGHTTLIKDFPTYRFLYKI